MNMGLWPEQCDHGTPDFRTCEDCLMQIADLKAQLAQAEARVAEKSFSAANVMQILRNSGVDVECGACAEVAFIGATTNKHTCTDRDTKEELRDRIGQAVTLMREETPNAICVMRDPKVGINQALDCGQCWYCRARTYIREYDTCGLPDYAKEHGHIVDGAIHRWFELTYAQYLTIPRTALQSMPLEWQDRFVRCLDELDVTIDWLPEDGHYWVKLKDTKGRYMRDPLQDYERGRRRLPVKS